MAAHARKSVCILGIRGIPGRHGGFETFAEDLAPFLARRGWDVTVYCQADGLPAERSQSDATEFWSGVRLIHIPVRSKGSLASIEFDWTSTRHAANGNGVALVLGYNTALFSVYLRLRGVRTLLNMDGLEWRRQKYNAVERGWFLANEWVGLRVATHLIADHPEIAVRCNTHTPAARVTTIPYGARVVAAADSGHLRQWNLTANGYALLIARPVPENSILEVVRAYSGRSRGLPLVVLGAYDRSVRYHARVLDAAGDEVRFIGPQYDRALVDALRFYAALYVHGHQVGGTNPSLVEALGAGCPVLAHDNRFNRWTSGPAAVYFGDEGELRGRLDLLLGPDGPLLRESLRGHAQSQHRAYFDLERRLGEYEQLMLRVLEGQDVAEGHQIGLPMIGVRTDEGGTWQ